MKRWRVWVAAAALVLPSAAWSQDYPNRPVTMVVAAAAGGPIDVFTRIMAERMGPILGQSVTVENVGGGGGTLGGQRVAKAQPDGYTALLGTIATHTNPQLYADKPLYDPLTDFVPVALIAEIPLILIVRKEFPANTFEEFVAYAKANQGKLNYGSAGVGSAAHLGCVMLDQAIGTNIQHVPYRGTAPAMQDLLAGRIDFLCDIAVTAVQSIKGGTVKGLANLSRPALGGAARPADRGREGLSLGAGLHLDGDLPAEGHAARGGGEAQRCGGRGDERPGLSRTTGQSRRDAGGAGAADARLSGGLREQRMGQVGRGDPRRRRDSEVILVRRSLQPGLDRPEQPEAHLAVIARERDHETHPPVA